MPLPLLFGISATAVLANTYYRKELAEQDALRRQHLNPSNPIGRYPCDDYPSDFHVTAEIGNVVCCGVYNGFIHTGIVIDHNAILELHGSGLARAVSYKRFLANRSGANIFVASDALGHPLNTKLEVNRVSSELFAYHKYHISKLNCYSHTWYCITGKWLPFASFEIFNQALSKKFGQSIYWDRMK